MVFNIYRYIIFIYLYTHTFKSIVSLFLGRGKLVGLDLLGKLMQFFPKNV